jgi:hypothetical protein
VSTLFKDYLASLGAPNFGEYWEGQGGILAAFRPGKDGHPDSFLIRSVDVGSDLTWGPYGVRIEGADDHYDGRANTAALLKSGHAHPAAEWAAEYNRDGHKDFYLPARRELNLIEASGTAEDVKGWIHSSTQYSASNAWTQDFDGGDIDNWTKYNKAGALAVRSISF